MFAAKNELLTRPSGYNISRSLRFRSSASAYLSRTPASAGNRTTWTWSAWVKRGQLNSYQELIGAGSNNTCFMINKDQSDGLQYYEYNGTTTTTNIVTTNLFRDFSAWYHIILSVDTTQATASNRVKMYVNGVQITSFTTATYPAQNYTTYWNNNIVNYIGTEIISPRYFDGYLAEVNFIDGQALTPTSFGAFDTNGVWQPKAYTGTYGTNGFYLNFSDNSGATATTIGKDSSGNSNNWTPNNISVTSGTTYDSMIDSPTNYADGGNGRGNYCTLNPLDKASGVTLSNANLSASCANSNNIVRGTIGMTSGKWYWEVTATSTGADIGLAGYDATLVQYLGQNARSWGYYGGTGVKINNAISTAYGNTFTTNDVIGIAFDATNGKLFFSKNNIWQNSGDPVAGTNAAFTTGLTTGPYFPAMSDAASLTQSGDFNFGQRPFTYTPPSGFSALNTQNLPTPTIAAGNKYFDATTYTGNGAASSGTTQDIALQFRPDFYWIKNRTSASSNNILANRLTGNTSLTSNNTAAEISNGNQISISTGLRVAENGGSANIAYNPNLTGNNYVAWSWLAANVAAPGTLNTNGSISSYVSANVSSGFSIVTYTGTGANATVGHGLGVAPSMIIFKERSAVNDWAVYHSGLATPATQALFLNLTNAVATTTLAWNSTAPTSSVFTVGNSTPVNSSANTYVAYCFAAVAGYSAFGSYTGNGSTDGPFIYTGFRPRWIMFKASSTAGSWNIQDTSRDTYNLAIAGLYADLSQAQDTSRTTDILSNGFKFRGTAGNASGVTYIYAAFCELPFKTSRAR